jgi:hypothetical protein
MRARTDSAKSPADPALLAVTGSDEMLAEKPDIEMLLGKADRCRRLAMAVGDRHTVETLIAMAREYEAQADRAETSH